MAKAFRTFGAGYYHIRVEAVLTEEETIRIAAQPIIGFVGEGDTKPEYVIRATFTNNLPSGLLHAISARANYLGMTVAGISALWTSPTWNAEGELVDIAFAALIYDDDDARAIVKGIYEV